MNGPVLNAMAVPEAIIESVTLEEQRELERRERAYRGDRPLPEVEGKTVIVVDDGVATGSTMSAAVAALRQLQVARIVVAAPVIALSSFYNLRREADEVAAVVVSEQFYGIGQCYEDFSQTDDAEVRQLLSELTIQHRP